MGVLSLQMTTGLAFIAILENLWLSSKPACFLSKANIRHPGCIVVPQMIAWCFALQYTDCRINELISLILKSATLLHKNLKNVRKKHCKNLKNVRKCSLEKLKNVRN